MIITMLHFVIKKPVLLKGLQITLKKSPRLGLSVLFLKSIHLNKMGLIQGANEKNVVVITQNTILTPLRFANRIGRHKLLDIIGDLD